MDKILRTKLAEIQRFLMANTSNQNDGDLKAKLKSMVVDKGVEKTISILNYIKEHLDDDLKTCDNGGRRYGIYERGSYFHMIIGEIIDDILDDMEEQSSKPQHKAQKSFVSYLLIEGNDKDLLLSRMHEYLDPGSRRGKDAAMLIKVCCDEGLMTKPDTSLIVKEFNIGTRQGFDNQWQKREYFEKDKLEGIKNFFKDFM